MSEPVVWQGLDHTALYDAVVHQGLGPAVSMDVEEQWRRIGLTVARIERDLTAAMQASESEWEGAAADATRTGLSPLGQWALDAAGDAALTANAVTDLALASAVLRSQLRDNPPVPPETIMETLDRNASYGTRGPSADEVAAQQAVQARRDGAAAKAVADARVYENIGFESRRTLDFWTVPPTVTVEPAAAGSSGGAGGGWVSPGGGGVPSPVSGAGSADLAVGAVPGRAGESGGVAGPGAGSPSAGAGGPAGVVPVGAGTGGGVRPGGAPPAAGGPAAGGPGAPVPAGGPGRGGRTPAAAPSLGRGGSGTLPPSPVGRPAPSPGGRGTGPGPWTRAATGARPGDGFRPVVPAVPPRSPTPGWRSVLLPPAEPTARPPADAGARTAAAASSGPAATRSAATPGLYPPMAGGGGGQGTERRRPGYLVDDSDAFADRRWVQPAVITPDDLVADEHGRAAGQDGGHE